MHAPAPAQRFGSSSHENVEKMDSDCISSELQLIVLNTLFCDFGGDDPYMEGMTSLSVPEKRMVAENVLGKT